MATRHRGPEKEVRALNALIALLRAAESVTARLHGRLSEASVTVGQFGAGGALPSRADAAERAGPEVAPERGQYDHRTRQSGKARSGGPPAQKDDRRCLTVHLTDAGRRLMERIFPEHVADVVRVFSVLTAAEQEELRRLCRTLGTGERK